MRRHRILRIIARMNIGGPAHHVSILSGRLDLQRYETMLVTGSIGKDEGSFGELASLHGAQVRVVDRLGPELGPADAGALVDLVRVIREFRPDIVHTHTAKAGTLGRLAARLAPGISPILVHTYHGHVLRGYFSPARTRVYREIERTLARRTDQLVAVSAATADDLAALGVADRSRIAVIPIGIDLEQFLAVPETVAHDRRDGMGLPDRPGPLALSVGRLVPIKRVDVLLRAMRHALDAGASFSMAIAGDGLERASLEALRTELGLDQHVAFLGFRHDLAELLEASDFAVLSSDSEGTPVSLMEASAAARPSVATRVGGVADIVRPGTGELVEPGDPAALGRAMASMAGRAEESRRAMGREARERTRERFGSERLLRDVDELYQELLAKRSR